MATRFIRRSFQTLAAVGLLAPALVLGQAPSPAGAAGGAAGTETPGAGSPATNRAGAEGLSAGDRKFIRDAASAGLAEVEMGQLAAQKGSDPAVKEFGERMVRDHGNANSELERVVSAKGVELPREPDDKHRRKLKDLQDKSGADFDKAYMKLMVDEHEKDVKAFEQQAKKGNDPQLKAFAEKTLATLQEHLRAAKETESSAKNRGKGKD